MKVTREKVISIPNIIKSDLKFDIRTIMIVKKEKHDKIRYILILRGCTVRYFTKTTPNRKDNPIIKKFVSKSNGCSPRD